MTIEFDAIYEDGVIKPETPLDLPEGTRILFTEMIDEGGGKPIRLIGHVVEKSEPAKQRVSDIQFPAVETPRREIRVVYEDGVFKPLDPVPNSVKPGQVFRLPIPPDESLSEPDVGKEPSP